MTGDMRDAADGTPANSARVARSRRRILAAATDLLVASGPTAVTVDAVVAASGVAKSTLYRQWRSRDELLIDVVRICNQKSAADPDPSLGFEANLRSFVRSAAVDFAASGWPQTFGALVSLRSTLAALDDVIDTDVAETRGQLLEILDMGIAEGRAVDTSEAEGLLLMLIGPLAFAALTAGDDGIDESDSLRLADRVVDQYLASISTGAAASDTTR